MHEERIITSSQKRPGSCPCEVGRDLVSSLAAQQSTRRKHVNTAAQKSNEPKATAPGPCVLGLSPSAFSSAATAESPVPVPPGRSRLLRPAPPCSVHINREERAREREVEKRRWAASVPVSWR